MTSPIPVLERLAQWFHEDANGYVAMDLPDECQGLSGTAAALDLAVARLRQMEELLSLTYVCVVFGYSVSMGLASETCIYCGRTEDEHQRKKELLAQLTADPPQDQTPEGAG